MPIFRFILKGIRHYRTTYWGVLAGAALSAMVLLGALIAGDSVQKNLTETAALRTGKIHRIFSAGERFFRSDLADRQGPDTAALLYLKGQVNAGDRAQGQVQITGVTDHFWSFAPQKTTINLTDDQAAITAPLARALDLKVGDTTVVRLARPGLLSRDAPLSGENETLVTLRVTIAHILNDSQFARFSLIQTQVPPCSIYLPLPLLQKTIEQEGTANALLLPESTTFDPAHLTLADYNLSVVDVPNGVEVRSQRIFLNPQLADTLPGDPQLTYLVNTLSNKFAETPYSMVTAVSGSSAGFLPSQPGPGEIIINDWLAEDLKTKVGEELNLSYFTVTQGSKLVEESATFRITHIIPMVGPAADFRWMPDFPGVADVKSARDWDPSLPLDLTRIRDKDDEYWENHKGTPKAFISYSEGARLWSNRWGALSGTRVSGATIPEIEKEVRRKLEPSLVGMSLLDFSAEAQNSATSPVDFGVLFISMSFFLILAAIALVAMLFRFNVEQRTEEGALLTALGIPAQKITRWRLGEAFFVILLGAIFGTILAIAFSTIVLKVIASIWGKGNTIALHLNPATLLSGHFILITLTLLAVWLTTRKQAKQSASMRLNSGSQEIIGKPSRAATITLVFGILLTLGGIGMIFAVGPQGSFFLIGFGVLLIGLALFRKRLAKVKSLADLSAKSLAQINLSRRASRSLTVVGVLAAGVFLVLSVASFRKNGGANWADNQSGAGGFALWVETTSPVSRPADSLGEIAWFDLEDIVPIRVGTGENVDCFNLTASAQPRLLGVNPSDFTDRFHLNEDWSILSSDGIPAIVDETTMLWVLKKKVGDKLTYQDEWGNDFEITIAGVVKDSIFQGSLLIAEDKLLEKYPSLGGYQLFLTPHLEDQSALQRATADLGGSVTPTQDRLAAFHEVENTYITIFNILGGLGIILGSLGVGIVTARNLAERQDEFTTLHKLGLAQPACAAIIKSEVRAMIIWGLGLGLLSALIAIIPVIGGTITILDLLWMLSLVLMMALIANFVGTRAVKKLT